MAKYIYPAVFTEEKDGGYSINFPDIEGCYTQGDDLPDGMEMAEDALALVLYGYEADGKEIPKASRIQDIKAAKNEIVTLIKCDTMEYRKMYCSKAVKKTLTIPQWLNEAAEKENINFSVVLQTALKEKLKVE
ncbi:MAG: type II toxin-antitoxin system HicB family antitoxin [Clostridia bacterium]|jgi:predicted RNase H-like HicB family nuclease|nr:type II toxin-antitoxin system HicB family antitoxin [Clostridia bacterium]